MEDISGDSQDDDDDHVPTFTPELAILKGEKMAAMMENDDDDINDGDDDNILQD